MNLLLVVALLVTCAYLGATYLFSRRARFGFYSAGVEFLLLGAILGSGALFQLPEDLFKNLYPFVHIELGWIGLLFGIQFDRRIIRRLAILDWGFMWLRSILTIIAVAVVGWLCFSICLKGSEENFVPTVLILAAMASLSSSWTVSIIYNIMKVRSPLVRRLFFVSVLDDMPGLILFSALFFIYAGGGTIDMILRFLGGTFTGYVLGNLIIGLLRGRRESGQTLVVLIGSVLLAAGVAYSLGIPVIYVTLLSGIVVINAKPRLRDIYPIIAGAEHPLYLLFLILAGALWDPSNMLALALTLVLIVARFASKWLAFELSRPLVGIPGWGGKSALALISPGGLTVAMVVNFALFADRFPHTQLVLDVTVWALVLLNPLGVTIAKRVLAAPAEQP
ncbi:MAG TPA: hypothetical protein ENL08_01515 [Bacteroidetes bacterium]|nr:hypothetical protein [Bacteroidota bacterium]